MPPLRYKDDSKRTGPCGAAMSRLKRLNDEFRETVKEVFGCPIYLGLDDDTRAHIKFALITADSDGDGSYGEFTYGTLNVYWLIVYRDINNPRRPSADPLNPEATERILCIGIRKN